VFRLEPLEPLLLPAAAQFLLRILRQREIVVSVLPAQKLPVRPGCQLLPRILAHRLQQQIAALAALVLLVDDE
jgi:hypothetical protein